MVGSCEELEEAFPCADAHEYPVEGHQEDEFCELLVVFADAGDGRRVEEDEVPGEEAECACGEDGGREEGVYPNWTEQEPDAGHQPVERIDEEACEGAADEQVEVDGVPEAQGAVECEEGARVDKPGLDVSLDPARALAQPRDDVVAGLLVGDGVEDLCPAVVLEDAQPQVAVFGDVVGIPSAGGAERLQAEMVGCSAQRERGLEGGQAGEAEPEPGVVFRREAGG